MEVNHKIKESYDMIQKLHPQELMQKFWNQVIFAPIFNCSIIQKYSNYEIYLNVHQEMNW